MKFVIFYFSGTGNTKWAVNEFNNSIIRKGYECKVYSIEDKITNIEEVISEADTIGFAFPIYGASMPDIMTKFINKFADILGTANRKLCFIMTTFGYVDAYGPFAAHKMLKRNGFNMAGYINIKMCNNIWAPGVKASIPSRDRMESRMNKGKEQINKLINSMIDGKRYIRDVGFYLLPGILVRRAAKNSLMNSYLTLSIDKARCRQCMLCINNCPTKSIDFSNKEFNFLPTCTACMRCYNFCPQYAIYHDGKYADPNIYRRYKGPKSIL